MVELVNAQRDTDALKDALRLYLSAHGLNANIEFSDLDPAAQSEIMRSAWAMRGNK